MTELPPDPPRLRAILAYLDQRIAETETVATYLRLQTTAVRQALAAAEKQPPNGRRLPPPRPQHHQPAALEAPVAPASDYAVEKQLHAGHPLGATVHRVGCTMIQRDTNPISADDARQALASDGKFFRVCEFCRPDTGLKIV
ncbi:DUF6233 domain-containing protein [Streptomyces sp. NPDC014846]|uniref:DUF6233 domain-containing protein n=1 Tax=Streptomyces sp. NPDC014846 TaxID=3364922 RepID=UPI0036FED5C6